MNAAAQGRLEADPHYVPDSLAEAIQQRFRMLSPTGQECAVAAAVVRRSFDLELLAAVAGMPVEDAAASLDELIDRHFVHEESPGWFGYRHALIRDAIEASAPMARRRALHARVAEEARSRVELGGDAYRSAHHEEAGQLAEASESAATAAERASALSAHQEALELLHRAVRCLGDDRERLADLLARRACEAAANDLNALAAEDFETARALLIERGQVREAAALLPDLVAARHLLGDPLPARIALLDEGLDVAGDGELRAALMSAKAAAYLVDDRLDEAIQAGEEALAIAGQGRVDPPRHRGDPGLGPRLRRPDGRGVGDARADHPTGGRARARGGGGPRLPADRLDRVDADRVRTRRAMAQQGHRVRRPHRAVEPPALHGRPPGARLVVPRAVGRGRPGRATRPERAGGRDHHPHRRPARRRVRRARPRTRRRRGPDARGGATSSATRWASCSASHRHCGGWPSARCCAATTPRRWLSPRRGSRRPTRWPTPPACSRSWSPAPARGSRSRSRPPPRPGRTRCPPTSAPAAIPGTLPAVDHAAGLIQLAAGRTGKARDLLGAARAGWSSRDRWWEAQWCALDLARCALASNRRTEASMLVEGVREAASAIASRPLLDVARELGSRLDEHDAAQPWSPLTLRELEVARLVAQGLTNREIAGELRITARTAGLPPGAHPGQAGHEPSLGDRHLGGLDPGDRTPDGIRRSGDGRLWLPRRCGCRSANR